MFHSRVFCLYKAAVRSDDHRNGAASDILGVGDLNSPDSILSVELHGAF